MAAATAAAAREEETVAAATAAAEEEEETVAAATAAAEEEEEKVAAAAAAAAARAKVDVPMRLQSVLVCCWAHCASVKKIHPRRCSRRGYC